MCFFGLLSNIHIDRDFSELWIQGEEREGGNNKFCKKIFDFWKSKLGNY